MSAYILGIDVGTTSVKAVLLEAESGAVAAAQALNTASDLTDHTGGKVRAAVTQTWSPQVCLCV